MVYLLSLSYSNYALDGAGALLTRLRMALTEWDSGYQEAREAAMSLLDDHPFLPSLLANTVNDKVCMYYIL